MPTIRPAQRLRGPLRELSAEALEDEAVYRSFVLEADSLAGRTLRAVSFEAGVMRGVTLDTSAWEQVRLADVRFEDCTFTNAVWTDVALDRVEFRGCRLLGLQAPGVVLRDVRLTGCDTNCG